MKIHLVVAGAAALSLIAASAWAAPPAAAPTPKPAAKPAAKPVARPGVSDMAALHALWRRWLAGFNARNVDEVMAAYAPDVFVFDVTPPRQHVGFADYKKDWQGLFAAFPSMPTTISDLKIRVVGPVAWSHVIVDSQATTKSGEKKHMVVRQTDVYRKLNGHWKIVQEHVSVPVDVMTGQSDLLSKP
ncbi:MAG TPA: nuclear transport factor 2 family protein [Caulobacteraceae bacterium]|nr:nuclear transport factor 2 family protein [Caulobacteraceae bacterium]